jgi:hypothetical protein
MRYRLDPGRYVIIPSTFNEEKDCEFMLRIYTEHRVDSTIQIKHLDKQKVHMPIEDADLNQKQNEAIFIRWQDFYPGMRNLARDILEKISDCNK